MAKERAEKAGMKASTVVRHGEFRQVLGEEIEKQNATTVVLGRPSEETSVTTEKYLKKLAQVLVETTGVEVLLVDHGEIVSQNDADREGRVK